MNHRYSSRPKALVDRTFRYKNPSMQFFCPLCRTERAINVSPHLTIRSYLQITLATMVTSLALWPWASWRGMFSFFLYWACFEAGRRIFFSREIPCPHCGFDASWYKRDVKVARRKVDEFWQKGEADSGVVTPPPKDQFEENVQILN